jgi:uncharacterized protein YciI
MAKYVLQLAFDKDNERRLAVRPRHREYLRALLEQAKLHTAGPWADDSGALIIYEVADEAEARALLAADPYIEADVVTVKALRMWTPILP